jgi:hypothetical protein
MFYTLIAINLLDHLTHAWVMHAFILNFPRIPSIVLSASLATIDEYHLASPIEAHRTWHQTTLHSRHISFVSDSHLTLALWTQDLHTVWSFRPTEISILHHSPKSFQSFPSQLQYLFLRKLILAKTKSSLLLIPSTYLQDALD